MRSRLAAAWTLAGFAVLALCALLPAGDPDLWWHLSAAERMLSTGGIPRADWLSFTLPGAPWRDFEWLGQLLLYLPYRLGGPGALWSLKALLLALTGTLAWRLCADRTQDASARAGALALWAACLVPRSDVRVELFSLLLFVLLQLRAAALRRGESALLAPAWACAAFFALWANVHPGFAAGLLFLALGALGELFELKGEAHLRLRAWLSALAFGALGTLLNPFGPRLYGALFGHAADSGVLSRTIVEWGPLDPARYVHWPALALIALLAAVFFRGTRRAAHAGAWLSALVFAVFALKHARFIPYLACAAAPLLASGLADLPAVAGRVLRAALPVFSLLVVLRAGAAHGLGERVFHDRLIPVQATAWLAARPELQGRRFYHPWGWGGYLGFALEGRLKVFQDGRYLFHPLFAESARAARSPEAWESFLDAYGVEAALVENLPLMRPGVRRYPDGSTRELNRPWYVSYFPRERWALLHSDERALVFARRSAFDARWLADREYRLLRPFDGEALSDALARGEVSREGLEAERERKRREAEELEAVPIGR